MRTSLLLLAAGMLVACGCDLLDDGVPFGKNRADCDRHSASAIHPGSPDAKGDTTVYLAAIEFPKDYDWQRDTAYGIVDCRLLLYRDYELVLSVSSSHSDCVVPDPDMHHIIEGHVYSVSCSPSRTLVGRDGVTLLSIPGGEIIKGIFPDGHDIYTLSAKRSGKGFSYRKNGDVLMDREEGDVYGSMQEPSYGPTGALYKDKKGALSFCYVTGRTGAFNYFMVRDGVQTQISTSILSDNRFSDVKVYDGATLDAPPIHFRNYLENGRVWLWNKGSSLSGKVQPKSGEAPFWGVLGSETTRLSDIESEIYLSEADARAVSVSDEGYVTVWREPASPTRLLPQSRFLCPSCATLLGSSFVVAISPRDIATGPVIIDAGSRHELDINGFVCCVRLEASPAS